MWNPFRKSLVGKHAHDITGEFWLNVTSFPPAAKDAAIAKLPLRFDHELSGIVTLVHFWDYSSADSVEDLPYLHSWWELYENPQFLIIGVHTPQYEFAKDSDKVEAAVLRFHLDYPIVNDVEYTTWKRYGSTVWPRKLLIDSRGIIRFDYSGRGQMDIVEMKLQQLLEEVKGDHHAIPAGNDVTPTLSLTRSTMESYGFPLSPVADPAEYHLPHKVGLHEIALSGWWMMKEDALVSGPTSDSQSCVVHFFGAGASARMSSERGAVVQVFLDTKQIGEDILVESEAEYSLVSDLASGAHHLTVIPTRGVVNILSFFFR